MVHRQALLVVLFCSFVFSTCSLLYGQVQRKFFWHGHRQNGFRDLGCHVRVTSQGTGYRPRHEDGRHGALFDPIAAGRFLHHARGIAGVPGG